MNYSGPFGLDNLRSDMSRKADKYEVSAVTESIERVKNRVGSIESAIGEIADLRQKCDDLQRMINELYGWREEEIQKRGDA